MPRSGQGVMSWPINTDAVSGETIESTKFNSFRADLLADLNAPRPISAGGTGASSASGARTALGLKALSVLDTATVARGGTGATTAAAARTNLGLSAVATDAVVPVARGGTGATTSTSARNNLGLGELATLDTVPISRGGTGGTSGSTARTALGLGDLATRDLDSLFYSGSSTGQSTFPVGSYVFSQVGAGVSKNDSVNPKHDGTGGYSTTGAGGSLDGTWKCRGKDASNFALIQRIS